MTSGFAKMKEPTHDNKTEEQGEAEDGDKDKKDGFLSYVCWRSY